MIRTRGFSLIEMLTVLAIMGVLAAIAFPSFSYLSRTTQIKAASNNIFLTLMKARSEAVKRNNNVNVVPAVTGWADGWAIVDTSSGATLTTQEALKGVRVTASITTQVTYLPSGRVSGGIVPTFSIEQPASDTKIFAARCISVSPNGAPYVKNAAC